MDFTWVQSKYSRTSSTLPLSPTKARSPVKSPQKTRNKRPSTGDDFRENDSPKTAGPSIPYNSRKWQRLDTLVDLNTPLEVREIMFYISNTHYLIDTYTRCRIHCPFLHSIFLIPCISTTTPVIASES